MANMTEMEWAMQERRLAQAAERVKRLDDGAGWRGTLGTLAVSGSGNVHRDVLTVLVERLAHLRRMYQRQGERVAELEQALWDVERAAGGCGRRRDRLAVIEGIVRGARR